MDSNIEAKVRVFLNLLKKILKMPNCHINICDHRDKNYIFYYLYNIDTKCIKQVLTTIEISDFVSIVQNKNPDYPPGDLYVFHKNVQLVNQAGDVDDIELYIKLCIIENDNRVIVISFHNAQFNFNN